MVRSSSPVLMIVTAVATVSLIGREMPTTSASKNVRFGWDPGLTHRCVCTPHADRDNYYEDFAKCPASGGNWTVAVQSETPQEVYGPTNQSFLINGAGSPVSLRWFGVKDASGVPHLVPQLATDFETVAHPGGAGYFTWFVLMDHCAHGGGPLPRPDRLTSQVRVRYDDSTPNGATRAFVGMTATWDGKTHGAEVCFFLNNWGDNDPAADVRAHIKNESLEFVTLDGAPLGIHITEGVWSIVRVPWHRIIADLTRRGYFTPPSEGWHTTTTAAVYVGTEVNNFAASGSARASLLISEFQVSD